MSRPFAGYTRVSKVGERGERLISPELQAQRIEGYAAARGLTVELLEPELDVSGGSIERPILSAALRGIEDGTYAGLIVAQLDRLSRLSLVDALSVIRRVEDADGQVIAVAENFDAGTPEGKLGRNVMLSLGEMQRDRYREGFRAAKQQAVERGIWITPTAPLGYRRGEDRRLVPTRDRRKIVRAFEARAAGKSWRAVGAVLGRADAGAAVIIRNRVYLGELNFAEFSNPDAHEPLVARDLWEAAQIEHPRPPRRPDSGALLTGLVRCASCGYAMSPASFVRGRMYRCMARARPTCNRPAIITQDKLDSYVEGIALAEIARLSIAGRDRGDDLSAASEGLQAVEAELVAFLRAVKVAGVGEVAFVEGLRSRQAEVETARRELAEARLRAEPMPEGKRVGELWPELSVDERRHVLRGALSVVIVSKGRGPCEDRVSIFATGAPVPSRKRLRVADFPAELRLTSAEDV